MCGIVGYMGNKQAQPILFNALKKLEYRGYDSSGIAVRGKFIQTYKDAVRVATLQENAPLFLGNAGIGHTRWATHGQPSQLNAHPHRDCSSNIAAVHNGVITNYQILKEQLVREGHHFCSETDTEVIPHLIEKYYRGNIEEAVKEALEKLNGSYAIAVLFAKEEKLIVAKYCNPLVIGCGDKENIIASDIPALLDYTHQVIYLEDGDVAVLTPDNVRITNQGKDTFRPVCEISWIPDDLQKGGYEHFMIKEIHEQPRVIRDTISEHITSDHQLSNACCEKARQSADLLILACGTSYHAGLCGKYIIEDLLGIPVRVELASEVSHRDRIIPVSNTIAITQSGETADVLNAMKRLKEMGSYIRVITNTRSCSASRLADETIYTSAGPEISVAATKSFIAQLIALYQLVISHPKINARIHKAMLLELRLLPNYIQQVLDNESRINLCARFLSGFDNVFFIGRGVNYPIALEGALKLKEISYIHSEGYAAGELKHGPFSLLQHDTPVIAIVAQDENYDSMLTNIKEVKSRNAPVISLINDNDNATEELVDWVIRVPDTMNIFSPVVNVVALQLLSYYTAKHRDCPIDFPRNLAKSVTVE
jgi:glutamine---fructose-6-phosphate transaminase (isomerizing)